MSNKTYVGHLSDSERFARDVQMDPGACGLYGDPEDMAVEVEEVRAISRAGRDAAFERGYEDGTFSASHWPAGVLRDAYVEGWNLGNPGDQRA